MTNNIDWLSQVQIAVLSNALGTGSIKVGYCTGFTKDAAGKITPTGEPTGVGGYARANAVGSAFGNAPTRVADTQALVLANSQAIQFAPATGAQGTFSHILIARFDGMIMAVEENPSGPIVVAAEGDAPRLNIGDITLTVFSPTPPTP